MRSDAIVLTLLFLPLAAAVVCRLLGPKRGDAVRGVSVVTSVVMLLLAIVLTFRFSVVAATNERPSRLQDAVPTFAPVFVPGAGDSPNDTTWNILPIGRADAPVGKKVVVGPNTVKRLPAAIQFYLGVDGLNVWLILLTALLMLPCVLVSFTAVTDRVHEYYAWLMALQTAMIGVFLAFDIVLFYVFFELTLIPLFFLIGIWGGAQRQYAAKKFVIYTLAGSLITLLGVLSVVAVIYSRTGELLFSLPDLIQRVGEQMAISEGDALAEWRTVQVWVFLAMSVGFAIKVPLLPFHTWLPLAHTEAPTAGSAVLAGVLLKIGSYAFLRICIPLAPDAALSVGLPLITWLSAIGIVYGALCAFAQDDMKKLIAYSSVSHLGLVMLGMFSLTATGLEGSLIQMINHGLSTPLLFLLIGMVYERYHTRMIKDYSGMASKMPLFAILLVFASLSSVGLPLLNGFVGEFLCLAGIYEYEGARNSNTLAFLPLTFLGASGMVLGAWYLFTMLRRILFGKLHEPHHDDHHPVSDLNVREWGLLVPLIILCVVLGFYPKLAMDPAKEDLARVVAITDRAKERAKTTTARAAAAKPADAVAKGE